MNVRASLILLMSVLSLGLAGCATPVKQIEISTKPIDKPNLVLPNVAKIKMRDVKWKVINKDNLEQIIADMEKKGDSVVFFALSDKGYESLALNIADLRKLVMEQKAIIAAYDQYYQNSQKAIDDANAERSDESKPKDEGSKDCKLDFLCKE